MAATWIKRPNMGEGRSRSLLTFIEPDAYSDRRPGLEFPHGEETFAPAAIDRATRAPAAPVSP